MDDLYRENILEHYKRPHNWSPPAPPSSRTPTTSSTTSTRCAAMS
jgi:NifU-like protein involved in Fe-S cluster formation